jgi:transposase
LADDRGRPVAFALTPGNVANVVMAIPLLGAVAKPKRVLADKAYDADSLRRWLKQRKIRAAIPSTASRRTPYPLDRAAYKRRNVIERLFCKLKNWRRLNPALSRNPKPPTLRGGRSHLSVNVRMGNRQSALVLLR